MTDYAAVQSAITMSASELDESDIQAVLDVLHSGRLALGPKTVEFEQTLADYVGVKHGIAVSSGTAGLHLLVKALNLGPGDEVLVPSFTFVSSVNAILYEGATPIFVDIEPDTYNLDPADLERKITDRTRAIMAVDVFGHPADWDAILAIAERHHLKIIDDSAEALGAEYKGRKVGQFGEGAVFAFYPNKQITTGEGGMIVTNDDDIAQLCRSLRNQGRGEMGAWLAHERLGYNYRLDEMSAALGLSQLRRIESFLSKREQVARRYTERLQQIDGVRPPQVRADVRSGWFVYVITLDEGLERDPVMRHMEEQGIPVRGYFSPVHIQPYIREQFSIDESQLPVTNSVVRRTIALPYHNNITPDHIELVAQALQAAVDSLG